MQIFEKIVENNARESNTTPENVLQEMQRAIDQAYDHRNAESQALWDRMNFKGERPTPEEFVLQVAMLTSEMNGLAQ